MRTFVLGSLTAAATIVTLLAAAPAYARQTVICESPRYGYQYCRADTDNRVDLVRQISRTRCRHGDNWGFDRRGIWVDRGCAAEFEVGSDRGGGAGTAAAVIAGAAIIAAIAAHSSKDSDVASWAVGTFRGYDEREGADVELTILPGGSVTGRAGRHGFDGRLDGNRLTAGNHVFRIAAAGNGFVADEERDGYRVHFRRVGSGY